jgi:nucleoside-diphosphate-sugar epimerase
MLHTLKVSHEMFNLNYVICRPHNAYGERQNFGDRYSERRLIPKWVKTPGARESNVFEAIEVHKNLPASWARVAQKSISFQ